MTYPNRLRVSPSGTFASDTNPLNEYAGFLYVPELASEYIGKIGPSDAAGGLATTAKLDINPFTLGANPVLLEPIDEDNELALSVGKWIVEIELGVGFNTSAPSADTYGDLDITVQAIADDGSPLDPVGVFANSPLPRSGQGTYGGAVVHSHKVSVLLDVSAENIAENDNHPISRLSIAVVRATGVSTGAYTTTSGWLEFTNGTQVNVRRYR